MLKVPAIALQLFVSCCLIACTEDDSSRKGKAAPGEESGGPNDANSIGDASKAPKGDGAKSLSGHTVLVLDDGFDTTHPVFKDKVVATYTIVCDEDDEDDWDSKSRAEIKKEIIEEYKTGESSCEIEEGIDFDEPSELKAFDNQKASWNAGIRAKTIDYEADKYKDLRNALRGAKANRNYHGTKTAGVIAYDNPDVKLVLMQLELRKPKDKIIDDDADCPKQRDIDLWVDIHGDADVKRAFIEAPLDSSTKALYDIAKKHQITLVNLSLGVPARISLEEIFVQDGCGLLDYADNFRLEGELEEEQERYRLEKGLYDHRLLVVQSAGNDGVKIDDHSATADCGAPTLDFIMVGSADIKGNRTDFSNFGKCVNYYTLGSEVVTAAPSGFLDISDGTSFSAPLTVRFLTSLSPNLEPSALIERLEEKADDNGFLDPTAYPSEIAFQNKQKIKDYALTASPVFSGALGRAFAPLLRKKSIPKVLHLIPRTPPLPAPALVR